ncbi:MAG: amidase domain-containing protein [Oscillospiraceae bacterium]
MNFYNREKAVDYAKKWAKSRNPAYYNFDKSGGDSTNFVSQSIFAGCGKMNYKANFGWYYTDINVRSNSWTGAGFFYKFIVNNASSGPYGYETNIENIEIGDIIQISYGSGFSQSFLVVKKSDDLYLCSHSFDCNEKALKSIDFCNMRCIHIEDVRI